MKSAALACAAVAAIALLLLLAPTPEATIACSDVDKDLRPCVNYLVNGTGLPPSPCCSGVTTLNAAASTTADRRAACVCIKSAATNLKLNLQLTQALAGNCGVSLPFIVSPNTDCSTIS